MDVFNGRDYCGQKFDAPMCLPIVAREGIETTHVIDLGWDKANKMTKSVRQC